jgi:hypothetical protein
MALHARFFMPIVVMMSGLAMDLCFDMDYRTAHWAKHGCGHCAPEGEQYSKQ